MPVSLDQLHLAAYALNEKLYDTPFYADEKTKSLVVKAPMPLDFAMSLHSLIDYINKPMRDLAGADQFTEIKDYLTYPKAYPDTAVESFKDLYLVKISDEVVIEKLAILGQNRKNQIAFNRYIEDYCKLSNIEGFNAGYCSHNALIGHINDYTPAQPFILFSRTPANEKLIENQKLFADVGLQISIGDTKKSLNGVRISDYFRVDLINPQLFAKRVIPIVNSHRSALSAAQAQQKLKNATAEELVLSMKKQIEVLTAEMSDLKSEVQLLRAQHYALEMRVTELEKPSVNDAKTRLRFMGS